MLDDMAYQVTDAIRSLPSARYQVAVAAILIELLDVYEPELPAFTTTLTEAVRSAISNISTARQSDQQLMLGVAELWESAEDQIDSSGQLTTGSYCLMLVLRALAYDAGSASAERPPPIDCACPFSGYRRRSEVTALSTPTMDFVSLPVAGQPHRVAAALAPLSA